MKSFYIIAGSCLFVCLFAGISIYFTLSSKDSVSNTKPAYEYYYNDDSKPGGDTLKKTAVANLTGSAKIHADILNPQRLPETNQNSMAVLINRDYSLPSDYVPPDLIVPDISFNISYYNEKKLMRKEAAEALEKLFDAAEKDSIKLNAVSGYRSYARQEEIYNENLRTKGNAHTNQYSAKPGYSEHQSGLSMDVSAPAIDNQLNEELAGIPEGKWLADHCYLFGFTIRYPKGKEDITFYSYEPWHLRYVGTELAGYLFENKLTLDEFYHYVPSEEVKNSISSTSDSMVDIDPIAEKAADPTQAPERKSQPADKRRDNTAEEEPESTPQKVQKTPKPSPTPSPVKTEPPKETPADTVTPTKTPVSEKETIPEETTPTETSSPEETPVETPPPKVETPPPKVETPPPKVETPPPKVETPPAEVEVPEPAPPQEEPSDKTSSPSDENSDSITSQQAEDTVPSAAPSP